MEPPKTPASPSLRPIWVRVGEQLCRVRITELQAQIDLAQQNLQEQTVALEALRAEASLAAQAAESLRQEQAVALEAQRAETDRVALLAESLRQQLDAVQALFDPVRAEAALCVLAQAAIEPGHALPETLRAQLEAILTVCEFLNESRRSELLSDLPRIELAVYTSPPAPGLLGAVQSDYTTIVYQITALQARLHERLGLLGIVPILAQPGESFNPEIHEAPEDQIVWVNDHPERNNTLFSMLKPGFLDQQTRTVLRKALVRRCVYLQQKYVIPIQNTFVSQNPVETAPPLAPELADEETMLREIRAAAQGLSTPPPAKDPQ